MVLSLLDNVKSSLRYWRFDAAAKAWSVAPCAQEGGVGFDMVRYGTLSYWL